MVFMLLVLHINNCHRNIIPISLDLWYILPETYEEDWRNLTKRRTTSLCDKSSLFLDPFYCDNWHTALCKFQAYNIKIWPSHVVKWCPQEMQFTSVISYKKKKRQKCYFDHNEALWIFSKGPWQEEKGRIFRWCRKIDEAKQRIWAQKLHAL